MYHIFVHLDTPYIVRSGTTHKDLAKLVGSGKAQGYLHGSYQTYGDAVGEICQLSAIQLVDFFCR